MGDDFEEGRVAVQLAALGNVVRLRLFRLLMQAGAGGVNVTDLNRLMAMPASTLAHHLTALARADLVIQTRRGREVICTAGFDQMAALVGYLTASCCAGLQPACADQTAA